jgi:hypothetical protein
VVAVTGSPGAAGTAAEALVLAGTVILVGLLLWRTRGERAGDVFGLGGAPGNARHAGPVYG